ncbi:MAG: DMT family transporter [Caldilineaceae bacterium]|nr:DMT family transporter [Caldilineaceae bacterium]
MAAAPSTPRLSSVDGALFALLLLVDSLHLVFARAFLPYFEPVLSATLVLGVGTIQVGIYGLWRGQLHLSSLRKHFWFYLAVGFLVGASTALSYTAVGFIDTGTASMLAKTSTLFSIGIGLWWLHERLHRFQLAGALLALIGVVAITFQPGDLFRWGALLIILSTAMYALHAALVKRYGNDIEFVDFFFFRLLFTTLTLGAIVLARPWTVNAPPSIWLLILVAGTVDIVISRTLYYLALRRLPMSLHAIILTISPVVTLGWAYLFFDTFPGPLQLLGGFVVIIGVALAAYFRKP